MRIGRPIPVLTVTSEGRENLERWSRRPKTSQALALRARIILACATGKNNSDVAARLRVSKEMVGKWRARFFEPIETLKTLPPRTKKLLAQASTKIQELGWIISEKLPWYEQNLERNDVAAGLRRSEQELREGGITSEVFAMIQAITQR